MQRPVSARDVPSDVLFELMGALRSALSRRGEYLAPEWFDRAVADLRTGVLVGWFLPAGEKARAGLAFLSERPPRGFGHVHVQPGEDAVDRAVLLTDTVREAASASLDRIDLGLTGLEPRQTAAYAARVARLPGFEIIRRFQLVRPLTVPTAPPASEPPEGLSRVPASQLPLDELQAADWEAFRGSPDAQLIAETPEANRRVLEGILRGDLGQYLPEASPALVDSAGHAVSFLLAVQENARRASFVDFLVLPQFRHRGIGRWTFGWAIRALTALGYTEVELWVTEANLAARALYAQFGFVQRAETAIYRWRRFAPASASVSSAQPHASR
jgi:GNAT superfamily N-acetyltransferase